MDQPFVMWTVVAAVVLGVSIYVYLDWQARLLRTRVVDLPGDGMRFESFSFSVEARRGAQQVHIQSRTGQWTRTPWGEGEPEVRDAPLDVTLPAAGLQIHVAPMEAKGESEVASKSSDYCTITIRGPEAPPPDKKAKDAPPVEGYTDVLELARVPALVAVPFQQFAGRLRVWGDNLERRQAREHKAALRKQKEAEEVAAQEKLLAEALASKAAEAAAGTLTEADRKAVADALIAQWRKAAGFTGNSSEVLVGPDGRIEWFIDLCNDGRVTLHSDKRTIHTTLRGASIGSLGGELDIGVRDDYWSEEDPQLRFFRLFKGLTSDERRAWKEKLDLVRNSLDKLDLQKR